MDHPGLTEWQQNPQSLLIAYFSAEFGIHECLPIYAGGLGILAGDHLKSASDLGIPLVGVGLLYQKGYFRQYLNVDGWQQELYVDNNFDTMPIELVRKSDGRALTISVEYPGRCISAQVWCVSIGRVKLYLLDTNIPVNSSADRMITASLYGGDVELRIRQEIMLGIGGLRALAAMEITPTCLPYERRARCFYGAGADPATAKREEYDFRGGRGGDKLEQRLYHAYSGKSRPG